MNYIYPKPITIEFIDNYRQHLLAFSKIDEPTIQNIWIKPNEVQLTDFENMVYDFDIPLFQKMIFRFKNSSRSPSFLWNSIDLGNRKRLISYFNMLDSKCSDLLNFFVWIKNGLGSYQIRELVRGLKEFVHILHIWHNENELIFFFALPIDQQRKLVHDYEQYHTSFQQNDTVDDYVKYLNSLV